MIVGRSESKWLKVGDSDACLKPDDFYYILFIKMIPDKYLEFLIWIKKVNEKVESKLMKSAIILWIFELSVAINFWCIAFEASNYETVPFLLLLFANNEYFIRWHAVFVQHSVR